MSFSRGNNDEDALVASIIAGSERGFELLIGRYAQSLFGAALYLTNSLDLAEKILVEVFYRAYGEISWAEKGESIRAWLFQLTVEAACEQMGLERQIELSSSEEASENVLFDAKQLVSFSRELVLEALTQLSFTEKAVFVLADICGLTSKECASALNLVVDDLREVQRAARQRIIALIKRSPRGTTDLGEKVSLTNLDPESGNPELHT